MFAEQSMALTNKHFDSFEWSKPKEPVKNEWVDAPYKLDEMKKSADSYGLSGCIIPNDLQLLKTDDLKSLSSLNHQHS